jgi:hypothetical protein
MLVLRVAKEGVNTYLGGPRCYRGPSPPGRGLQLHALFVAYKLGAARLVVGAVARPLRAPAQGIVILVALVSKEVVNEVTKVGVIGLVIKAAPTVIEGRQWVGRGASGAHRGEKGVKMGRGWSV